MSLFSKSKVVLWPKKNTVEVYLDRKDNNTLTFDLNLWQEKTVADLQPLELYFKQNQLDSCSVLIRDDVAVTKSFIYDSQIDKIDKKEVLGLAQSFVKFDIDADSLQYDLVQINGKTIIQAVIYDQPKINLLKANLQKINLKVNLISSVSSACAKVISSINTSEYFLVYPLEHHEYTLILAKGSSVYLSSILKGQSPDIQKIINYSNLYFSTPITKIYLPSIDGFDVVSTAKLVKTSFHDNQIAQKFDKPTNLPLPVIGLLVSPATADPAIITPMASDTNLYPPMQNKKNILPLVAVFIFTAALASVIIWFVLNRNTSGNIESPTDTSQQPNIPTESIQPTDTPTPTVTEISKTLKLQVLNATDINGQAATLKEKLSNLKFSSIAVGNSATKLTSNQIKLKPSQASAQAYFESMLGTYFPATYTTDLKENSTYDVVFLIGTDLSTGAAAVIPTTAETATPTVKAAKPTPTVTGTQTTVTPTVTP